MSDDTISLRVSREELGALLQLLDIPSLPGMGAAFLEGLNNNEQALVLAAGRHALRAHGWMEERLDAADDILKVEVDPTLLALVGECSRASVVSVVSRYGPTPPPTVWYVHQGPNLRVIHHIVASGVHEFVGTVDAATVQAAVIEQFPFAANHGILSASNGIAPFFISQSDLDKAIDLVRNEQHRDAVQALRAAGLEDAAADVFAAALQEVTANSMLARLDIAAATEGSPAPSQAFSLIEAGEDIWMLRPEDGGNARMLQIERISGTQFFERLEKILA